jgi:hypothetical protein
MSDPTELEPVTWLRAHANRDLTSGESAKLRAFAAKDAGTAAALASMEALHATMDDERELFAAVAVPISAAEASDGDWQRLAASGARAEAVLRGQLRFGELASSSRVVGARSKAVARGWWWVAGAAAAMVLVAILWRTADEERPSLIPTTPNERVLGSGARIVLTAELRLDRPVLSWHVVVGAKSYDAVILGPTGDVLAQRAEQSRASTSWELEAAAVASLRTVTDRTGLRLRVVARDSLGLPLATSGDLPLTIVE